MVLERELDLRDESEVNGAAPIHGRLRLLRCWMPPRTTAVRLARRALRLWQQPRDRTRRGHPVYRPTRVEDFSAMGIDPTGADREGFDIIDADVQKALPAQRAAIEQALPGLRQESEVAEASVAELTERRLGPALAAYGDTVPVAEYVRNSFLSRIADSMEAGLQGAGDANDPKNDLATAGYLGHRLGSLVAREIDALIRGHHRLGAMARWRTMYEAYVVLKFLNTHASMTDRHWTDFPDAADDEETSTGIGTRFLLHADSERLRHLRELDSTGTPVAPGDRAEVEATMRDHVETFGEAYRQPYGWAAPWIPGPSFARIQTSLGSATINHRGYYRRASWAVHVGAHGLFGLPYGEGDEEGPTRGLSGLGEIGSLASHVLAGLTREMVGTAPDIADFASCVCVDEQAERASGLFLAAHRRIEAGDH